jgi:predicted nuclease of restriction endonuclease-like (RecB) superfamily
MTLPADYAGFLHSVKSRIQTAQVRASLSVNRELILLYWEIGQLIAQKQEQEGWGAGVIPQLALDLRTDLPDAKGFSERNLKYMVMLAREYGAPPQIGQQAVAQLQPTAEEAVTEIAPSASAEQSFGQQLVAQIPWGHNILLLQKVKDLPQRLWYMQETIRNGWSRNVLSSMIESDLYSRSGSAVTNFPHTLPAPQSDLAQQTLKDPYIFNFLTLDGEWRERDLENQLIDHLQRFLVELGSGFFFVGRQYHVEVEEDDFYIDLLFYHHKLRCFIVIDLKMGAFKPEYAGKMNFYLSAVDGALRHPDDQPSIGIVLCQDRKRIVAEYALRGMSKPIGVSEYELTRALPQELASSLPTIEQIEEELSSSSTSSDDEE